MFLLGVTGFTLCSASAAWRRRWTALIAARVLQGLAGAMMMPQVLAIAQIDVSAA